MAAAVTLPRSQHRVIIVGDQELEQLRQSGCRTIKLVKLVGRNFYLLQVETLREITVVFYDENQIRPGCQLLIAVQVAESNESRPKALVRQYLKGPVGRYSRTRL